MEQFKFPLQKLLDIRIDKEEQSKLKLMDAQKERNAAEAKLKSLKESYDKYNVYDKKLTIVEHKLKNNYLTALEKGIKTADKELKIKDGVVDNCRLELKEKQIERKTVETIKDKRYEAFKQEIDRKEQIQNDEFALYAFIRNIERR